MVVVGPSEAWVLQVISITFQVHKGKSHLGWESITGLRQKRICRPRKAGNGWGVVENTLKTGVSRNRV